MVMEVGAEDTLAADILPATMLVGVIFLVVFSARGYSLERATEARVMNVTTNIATPIAGMGGVMDSAGLPDIGRKILFTVERSGSLMSGVRVKDMGPVTPYGSLSLTKTSHLTDSPESVRFQTSWSRQHKFFA